MDGVITTIKQNCRRCYTCVRDCPAKAIRIEEGQASVVADRCIACGNCTMVCSQGAKAYRSGIESTLAILDKGVAAALVAPSFPVSFAVPPAQVVGALRQLGFTYVIEVAYGADLVNQACHDYLAEHPTGIHIASACPAVVEYVRKYRPELTDRIMPIVSPMVAAGLAVKERYGQDVRCVFIGPCVAKKAEILDGQVVGVVDEVLTFAELQRVFTVRGIDPARALASDFDPPHAGKARVYPIPGGMLESAGLAESMLDHRLIVVSGKDDTLETLTSLPDKDTDDLLLVEALMCKGCYSGPGVETDEPGMNRRRRVMEFAANSLRRQGEGDLPPYEGPTHDTGEVVCLTRRFEPNDQRPEEPTEEEIREILGRTNKFFPEDELNCGACGYPTCRAKAIAVHAGMAEEAMCLPFIIDQAERVCHELHVPWSNLRDVHRHLINSEKLASMGQMAAGVAHELNNPLSTILLYAHILQRKLKDREDLSHDLALMAEESNRCKKIIGNLLDFARQSRVRIETVSVEELVASAIDGAACNLPPGPDNGITIAMDVTPGLTADLDRDQMTQVLVNLIKNGVEAMEGRTGTIIVKAYEIPDTHRVHISVTDQGAGIPAGAKDKVFQPFFTTKSIGKGTGLGLPISYGIVKMHNGNIWFDSEQDVGTTFHVEIPMTHASGERSPR
jgi:nitrogen-specific signal transduction histidine kinase/iron only hydrogenase large subunit-like protein